MHVCVTFQAYFSKMPAKICNLRVDTLAIMLSQANVQAYARVRPGTHPVQFNCILENIAPICMTSRSHRSPVSGCARNALLKCLGSVEARLY